MLLLTLVLLFATAPGARAQAAWPAPEDPPSAPDLQRSAPETPPPAPEDTPTRQIAPQPLPFSFRWGPERLGLIRYNRVEGLSVGVHAAALPLWHGSPVRIALTARLGSSGPLPSGRLELERVTLRNRVGLSVFGEVAAIDPAADPLGPVSSMLALVAGRDDGDYHRRSGGSVWWASPPGAPLSYRIGAHATRHDALSTATRVALPRLWDDAWRYRPNLAADEGWEHGMEVELAVRLGNDPRRLRGRVAVSGLAATGATTFTRGAATAQVGVPLPAGLHVELVGSGGASAGAVSAQRLWALGGPTTLRGFGPRARVGGCFWRARAELARSVLLGELVAFSDVGDATSRCGGGTAEGVTGRPPGSGALASVGGGLFLLDRVIRITAAWAVDGGSSRVDVTVVGGG